MENLTNDMQFLHASSRHNTKKFPSVVTEMVVLIFLTKHAKS